VRWAGLSLLDPRLRRALRYDEAPALVSAGVEAALRMRKHLLAWMPARRDYVSPLDRMRLRTYPRGYDIAKVGTFPDRAASQA
jgi:hypothetical protein